MQSTHGVPGDGANLVDDDTPTSENGGKAGENFLEYLIRRSGLSPQNIDRLRSTIELMYRDYKNISAEQVAAHAAFVDGFEKDRMSPESIEKLSGEIVASINLEEISDAMAQVTCLKNQLIPENWTVENTTHVISFSRKVHAVSPEKLEEVFVALNAMLNYDEHPYLLNEKIEVFVRYSLLLLDEVSKKLQGKLLQTSTRNDVQQVVGG